MLADLIKYIFDKLHIVTTDFNLGFFAGVGLALTLVMILMAVEIIFILFFRQKKCAGINIIEADGDTFISKTAISSLIMNLEKDFPLISIKKLLLYKRGKKHSLKIYLDFNDDGSGLPPQNKKLKSEINSRLSHTFGINTIKKINLNVNDRHQQEPKKSAIKLEATPKADKLLETAAK
jgi:hypothetical protein